jgi:hypothetical protein
VRSAHPIRGDQPLACKVSRILNEYPEEVISHAHKIKLHPELVGVICREHDPLVLIQFLKRRITEFKSTENIEKL